jgi:hypothetical protein
VTDDEPNDEPKRTDPQPISQVFVLRVWTEAGALRLRIVPAANDAAPRYFGSWRALAEWGEHVSMETISKAQE